MPFRFLFCGGRRKPESHVAKPELEDEDALSTLCDSEEDMVFYEEKLNEVYFMNPGFEATSRPRGSPSPAPSLKLTRRQLTRRMSSRVREYRRVPSIDASEIDVDVMLAPSAFAFQNVPSGLRGHSFCSRDDSEIVTKTITASPSPGAGMPSGASTPYANPMFLHTYSFDDSDIGSSTLEKRVPLRHMGSALSYRVALSGTQTPSICGDSDCPPEKGRGHARRFSDMSDRLTSFKERNKMIRLESLVGGIEKADSSVLEFGILNPSSLNLLPEQPTPRLFRPTMDQTTQASNGAAATGMPSFPPERSSPLSSFPIQQLSGIAEEDDDILEFEDVEEDAKTVSSLSSISQPNAGAMIRSSFRLRVPPLDLDRAQDFSNPAFGEEASSPIQEPPPHVRATVTRRMSRKHSTRGTAKEDDDYFATASRNKKHQRDETLHTALMERYLLQSVVNKYLIE